METRLYFLFGDIVSNAVVGALSGLVCAALIATSWNELLAMIVGMALGMFVALPCGFGAGIFFGALEVMVPLMLTGMVSGMVVGMLAAMEPLALVGGVKTGAGVGLAVLASTYLANVALRGEVKRWTS